MRTHNLAFMRTYTFRIKSTESFINETPRSFTYREHVTEH